MVDGVLAVDEERRRAIAEVEELKARRNEVSKEIGALKRTGGDADDRILEMRSVGERIANSMPLCPTTDERIRELLLALPNLPLPEVPAGGEEDNVLVRELGGRTHLFLRAPTPLGAGRIPGDSGSSPGSQSLRLGLSRPPGEGRPAPAGPDRLHARPSHRGAWVRGAEGSLPGHGGDHDRDRASFRNSPRNPTSATGTGSGWFPRPRSRSRTSTGTSCWPATISPCGSRPILPASGERPGRPGRTPGACCGSTSSTRWSWFGTRRRSGAGKRWRS